MMMLLVSFVKSSLKNGWKGEVRNFFIHMAKVAVYFGFGKWDLGFFNFCLNSNFSNFSNES